MRPSVVGLLRDPTTRACESPGLRVSVSEFQTELSSPGKRQKKTGKEARESGNTGRIPVGKPGTGQIPGIVPVAELGHV
jgi:hypothetical protein